MTNKSNAYRKGYETARMFIETDDVKGLHKHMVEVVTLNDDYFEGLASAEFDHENGNGWEF